MQYAVVYRTCFLLRSRCCGCCRKSKENLCKIEVLDQKPTFSTAFCNFSYGDLTFVGTSATECTFLLFHLKYLILYEALIDICIFKLTFYEAFLTIAMQKCREGCTFSSKISTSLRRNPTLAQAISNPRIPRIPRIPRKRCQRPQLVTSPTRAGGRDDVS